MAATTAGEGGQTGAGLDRPSPRRGDALAAASALKSPSGRMVP